MSCFASNRMLVKTVPGIDPWFPDHPNRDMQANESKKVLRDEQEEPEEDSQEEFNEETKLESHIESLAPISCNSDGEEPEENPEEAFTEETKLGSQEDSFAPPLSDRNGHVAELIEDQTKYNSEDHSSKSFSDISGCDHCCSKEKKRQLNSEELEPGILQICQLKKKCRHEDLIKPESDIGSAIKDNNGDTGVFVVCNNSENVPKQEEHSGSSGKRRCARWGPEHEGETGEGDSSSKRRKTRWTNDDSQLKMLGPMHLPDFMKNFIESELDPEIKGLKMKLMEINHKLQSSVVCDDRPEEERSPSPEPVYNNLGIRTNTREVTLRKKLTDECALIVSKLVKKNSTFKTPPKPKPTKFLKKLYVPVKEYPTYNFVGLIIGPRGNTQKKMEKETGAKIYLRGKGSVKSLQKPVQSDDEDLHVCVEADNQKSLEAALTMVEKLLIPLADGNNEHKRAQLAELAKLNGTYKDENKCNSFKDQGHREYTCPGRKSTFEGISCDSCGSFSHLVPNCPVPSSQVKPSWSSSRCSLFSTPNTKSNFNTGIDVTSLYVGCLSQTMDANRLKELFLPFGRITEARVIKDRNSGLSKGYAFVKFEDATDAAAAVAHLNGIKMDGKMLVVRVAWHMAVADRSPLSNLAISLGLQQLPPASSGRQPLYHSQLHQILPQAQPSFLNNENLTCPSSNLL